MNKKLLLTIVASLSIAVSTVGALSLTSSNDFKIGATDNYTCELPAGYHEISDVIKYLKDNGDCDNPYNFRGTVTKIVDKDIFVQRVNQTTLKLDSIKIIDNTSTGLNLIEGNVVDITGGYLSMYNDQPVLGIDSSDYLFVSFDINPTGFGPKEYGSFSDYYYNEFDDVSYVYSKLIHFANARFISNTSTYFDADHCYYNVATFEDLFSNQYFKCLLKTDDYQTILDVLDDAKTNNHDLAIRGVYSYCKESGEPYVIVTNSDDIIDDGVFLDTNVVASISSAYNMITANYSQDIKTYTMVGKDENIVYVNFAEFFQNTYSNLILNPAFSHLTETRMDSTNKYIFHFDYPGYENYLQIAIDATTDEYIIVQDSFRVFSPIDPIAGSPRYIANGIETNFCTIVDSVDLAPANNRSFNLGNYNIDIIKDKYDNMYLPINVVANIIFNCKNYGFGFNGRHLFYLNQTINNSTMLGWYLYDTPWSNETTRSAEFANYTYNELRFLVENFYGLYNEKIPVDNDLDSLITSMGLKSDLLSTDTLVYERALGDFAARWFSDGHSRYVFPSSYVGNDYQTYINNGQDYSGGRNDRVYKIYNDFAEIEALKEAAGKDVGLEISDNTAIIRFDQFVKYQPQDLDGDGNVEASSDINLNDYTYEELHSLGSDLLFKKAFDEISTLPQIENVVVDLVDNGGGMLDSIPFLEAYFTADPSVTVRDQFTGETIETHYALDLDFDGTFGDTYEGQYDFFLLTSNASFSCGNYFPTVMKEKHAMTIIGETSGGGECAVGMFSTASGAILRNSSFMHLGHYDYVNNRFVGNDGGITPDFAYPRAQFYNTEYLVNFINDLKA